jgi:hypothetical protein
MSAVSPVADRVSVFEAPPAFTETSEPAAEPRRRWAIAVGALLLGSFALRLWGVKHGLPYAYNADENAHFVPKAIGLFGHGLNPDYFVNPPAYTYVLHAVFAVWFGGREGVAQTFATDPATVFVIGRIVAAVLGTVAVWLLYLTGARLFDRRTGLLAAGLLGVAFLPVFYSHLALNDVPTLAPLCLSLYGTAGILRLGRPVDYVVAGIGLGLACATKYTGGIVLAPLLAAAAAQYLAPGGHRPALVGVGLAFASSLVAFLVANPYSVLDWATFQDGLNHQSSASADAAGKLGLTQDNGLEYYLWTLTWALGWVPTLAAAGGAVALLRDERRLVGLLAPAPILFLLFMGSQERFFGRWLMPILPLVCLLAAYAVLELAESGARRRPLLRPTLIAVAVVALCGQAVVHSVHLGLVLSRDDTRNMARDWLVEHVPTRTKIVVEPVVPDQWAQDLGHPSPLTSNGNRWVKFPTSRSQIANDGSLLPQPGRIVNIEDYERTTHPKLIDQYERQGYCWVVSGSTQSGRAIAEPDVVPNAIAYYRELGKRAEVAYRASPYGKGEAAVGFNFDWSFDYYPLAYHRPGPVMTVFRLTGGNCARR